MLWDSEKEQWSKDVVSTKNELKAPDTSIITHFLDPTVSTKNELKARSFEGGLMSSSASKTLSSTSFLPRPTITTTLNYQYVYSSITVFSIVNVYSYFVSFCVRCDTIRVLRIVKQTYCYVFEYFDYFFSPIYYLY